jgi:hypothetical protein
MWNTSENISIHATRIDNLANGERMKEMNMLQGPEFSLLSHYLLAS